VIPVVITVYQDKSFSFITKSPPASILLKKAAGITAGSKTPNKEKVGKVTRKQGSGDREVEGEGPQLHQRGGWASCCGRNGSQHGDRSD
jgi:hypothetical protein